MVLGKEVGHKRKHTEMPMQQLRDWIVLQSIIFLFDRLMLYYRTAEKEAIEIPHE